MFSKSLDITVLFLCCASNSSSFYSQVDSVGTMAQVQVVNNQFHKLKIHLQTSTNK